MFDGAFVRRGGRWVPVALALLLGGAGDAAAQPAARALAEPGKVQLVYTVPRNAAGCDDEATFRKLAGNGPDGHQTEPFALTGPQPHVMNVTFSAEPEGFGATAELRDAAGNPVWKRRVFERTCGRVIDYLVFLLGRDVFRPPLPPPPPPLECDPCKAVAGVEARLDRLEETTEAQDVTSVVLTRKIAELEKKNAELGKALEAEKKKMDLTYTLATGFLLTANLTSNVGPGVWLGGDVRSGPLSLGLELRSLLPARVVVGPHDLDLSQFGGLLIPCGHISYFFGCAVAGAGVQLNTDSDYPSPSPATQFGAVIQLGGRIGGELPFAENRFAVRGWAEVLYTTPSSSFSYEPDITVNRPDVSAFFGLGFVVKLGQQQGAP